jgi:hypothetical protein
VTGTCLGVGTLGLIAVIAYGLHKCIQHNRQEASLLNQTRPMSYHAV